MQIGVRKCHCHCQCCLFVCVFVSLILLHKENFYLNVNTVMSLPLSVLFVCLCVCFLDIPPQGELSKCEYSHVTASVSVVCLFVCLLVSLIFHHKQNFYLNIQKVITIYTDEILHEQ